MLKARNKGLLMKKGNVMQPPAGFECPQATNSRGLFVALHKSAQPATYQQNRLEAQRHLQKGLRF
jgi:hypothetical protein